MEKKVLCSFIFCLFLNISYSQKIISGSVIYQYDIQEIEVKETDKNSKIIHKLKKSLIVNKDKIKYQNLPEGALNAHHLFVIEVEDRKGLYDFLRTHNIFAQIHYIPVHKLPYYQNIGYGNADLSNAENYYSKCISLPMFPSLTNEEQQFVIDKVLEFIND